MTVLTAALYTSLGMCPNAGDYTSTTSKLACSSATITPISRQLAPFRSPRPPPGAQGPEHPAGGLSSQLAITSFRGSSAMKHSLSRIFASVFVVTAFSLVGCSSGNNSPAGGGSQAGAITATGGASAGGTTTASTSAPSSGGIASQGGTPETGGQTQSPGGSAAQVAALPAGRHRWPPTPGGSVVAGSASGGEVITGGESTGGAATGGVTSATAARPAAPPVHRAAQPPAASRQPAARLGWDDNRWHDFDCECPIGGNLGSSDGTTPIKVWMAAIPPCQARVAMAAAGKPVRFCVHKNVTVVNSSVAGRSIQTWLYDPT